MRIIAYTVRFVQVLWPGRNPRPISAAFPPPRGALRAGVARWCRSLRADQSRRRRSWRPALSDLCGVAAWEHGWGSRSEDTRAAAADSVPRPPPGPLARAGPLRGAIGAPGKRGRAGGSQTRCGGLSPPPPWGGGRGAGLRAAPAHSASRAGVGPRWSGRGYCPRATRCSTASACRSSAVRAARCSRQASSLGWRRNSSRPAPKRAPRASSAGARVAGRRR